MEIKLTNVSLHDMDIENNKVRKNIPVESDDNKNLLEYTTKVITEIYTPPKRQTQIRGQYYTFSNEDELIPRYLKQINQDPTVWEQLTEKIAKKLLSIEVKVYDKVANLNGLREGSLLQAHFTFKNEQKIALIKIDTNQILDKVLKIRDGLPVKTRVQKVAVISFDSSNIITSLLLSDTNSKITEYWRDAFLNSEPVQTNEQNTKNAFEAIDTFLKRKIKSISKQDFYYIRNKVILDFRKNSFEFNNLVSDLQNYEPINDDLAVKFNKILSEFEELPQGKKKFDTQFEIDPTMIKARLKKQKMVIDNNFDLIIKTPVEDLKTIFGVGVDDGGKFVRIYSEDGYNAFKR
ncbi:MAG: nucleoid-associated protein [Snodgrassella sp.]|uniref:nucleoid-associated protein n=1 Tax=Snodgrassella sp. TaxID=2815304 RepID=UPI00258B8080|nr:nucleoid-associated protein [Snodgrassella sp.]MCO6508326.1 nucleoid-associated protein [Snodgrassella sp.]